MKIIGITQREDFISTHKEIRDSLDQRWMLLFVKCGFLPIILPNHVSLCGKIVTTYPLDGIIITGGSSVGEKSNRRLTETFLLRYALDNTIPLFGVCNGMQVLAQFFGSSIQSLKHHTNTRHTVIFADHKRTTNSYHSQGITNLCKEFTIIGSSEDGAIEAIQHEKYRCQGIMWHPEREEQIHPEDIQLLKGFFQ